MSGVRLYLLLIAAVLVSGLATLLPFAWAGSQALSLSYREAAERDLTANAGLLALSIPAAASEGEATAPAAERDLTANAGLLALALPAADADVRELLSAASEGEAEADVRALLSAAREKSSARYTLLLPDGRVVADSDEEPERMENHANRPEVRAALAGGTGVEVRRSPTLDGDWLYVATALPDGRVLRAAASMAELNGRLNSWWKQGAWGLAASVVVLLVMALFLARLLSRPLELAATAAEKYAAGDFTFRPPPSGSLETRRLSGAMGRMAAELDSRFRLITRQRGEMQAVFKNMTEGVLAVDAAGTVILSNDAAERLLGAEANHSGWNVAVAVRNADLLDAIRTAASGGPVETEIRIRVGGAGAAAGTAAGAAGETLLAAHAVRMADGTDGAAGGGGGRADDKTVVLVVLRDVTRLRRLEVMRRDFVANVSHELRTPITTIQSSLEALQDDNAVLPAGTEFLGMALRNARRLGSIVSNLLLLAGMESGGAGERERPSPAAVLPVLTEAAELCRADAAARKVTVTIDCETGLTAVMTPALVVQAVANLLDNAIKYGPESGAVDLTARRLTDGRAEIAVSDNGPGIAPRQQSRVFERFYRADGSTRVKRGAGLGLAIVSHIAQSLGGAVRVESSVGSGSVFLLTLPGPQING